MLIIPSRKLSESTAAHLAQQQADIDAKANHSAQYKRAKALWKSKTKSKAKDAAFTEIKQLLKEMSVGIGYCNYCEHGETYDIEHVYPKSIFPNKTFEWENYLYACKACNTGEKLDKFSVFDAIGQEVDVKATLPAPPISEDGLLLHPRKEDPMYFLTLDLIKGTFTQHPKLNLPRNTRRAQYTVELLRLNQREGLVQARKDAASNFFTLLKDYIAVQQARKLSEIDDILYKYTPKVSILFEELQDAKTRTQSMFKERIQHSNHQTVWAEMKRQHTTFPLLNTLFQQAPEALNW